ncbi:hypothetical protein Gotri_012903 [Gossypium trilobum]|uniref:Uncharacterized protein n=1 Tax=Gossypium trilobum TaxID=34281 RepID=A0A7J9DS63_9ROSI|nr:hypothetical protein [Gossypium trilobum]
MVPIVQEFYASLQDYKSRNIDSHIWDIVFVRGIEVKEVGESSHPKLDWMIQWMKDSGPIFQEFAKQNNINVPNYTPEMFGHMTLGHAE